MHYKNLEHASLFEFAVGLVALGCVFAFGAQGMFVLAILAIRRRVLEWSGGPQDSRWHLRLRYDTFKWSLLLTSAMLLVACLLFNFLPVSTDDKVTYLLMIVPWLVVNHGFVGFVLARLQRQRL